MNRIVFLFLIYLFIVVHNRAECGDTPPDVSDIQRLQQYVESLERRLQEQERQNRLLRDEMTAMKASLSAGVTADASNNTSTGSKSSSQNVINFVNSKYPVDLFGYIKFDASYDSSHVDGGNFTRWVLPKDGENNDGEFNATANQSRFGLNFHGPEIETAKTSAKIEVDFYEGGSENKARLMMRHAYLQLDWPDWDFNILAGQTWDVISPLAPNTLNYPVAWWVGDIGYRRPQLRFTKGFSFNDDIRLQFQAAATRTIGDSFWSGLSDTGDDSDFPTLQTRTALSTPIFTNKPTILGLSGHWGQETNDFHGMADPRPSQQELDTWSVNVDLTFPLLEWLTFSGEVFAGENLDAYLGGVAQGTMISFIDTNVTLRRRINSTTYDGTFIDMDTIASRGGWAQLAFGPFGRWQYNLGGSIDDPDDGDLPDGARSQNYSIWGNTLFDINPAVQLGLEVSYWNTSYKGDDEADSIRVQSSLTYKF